MRVVDVSYYQSLLEALYTGLQDLPVAGYREAASNGWVQARHLGQDGMPRRHLEALVDLGDDVVLEHNMLRHAATIQYHHRYSANDDSLSQAQIHASARHVLEFLAGWHLPTGERTVPDRYALALPKPEWALVTVQFHLFIPGG